MTDWSPIETLPEGQDALLYAPYEPHFSVGKFKWRVMITEEVVSSSSGKSGLQRKIVQEKEERDREWGGEQWGATHWMPLPPGPT